VLGREAVILNWRLFWRSLRLSSGELWIVVAITLLSAATMGPSAVELGEALASNQVPRGRADGVVGLWLWATFLAAFGFSLATGELPFLRNLLADLALRPLSRWQAFTAAQSVWTAGPHALACVSVGLPWLIVLVTWLSGAALLAAIVATFVMMRLPAGLLVTGSRWLSASLGMAATALAFLFAALAALWLAVPDVVMTWSPPGLVSRIVIDDGGWSAWAGLAMWTFAVGIAEYWSAGLDRAPRSAPVSPLLRSKPIPAAILLAARLGRSPAVLLHGELIRLARWRRYQLSCLAGALFAVALGSRLHAGSGLIRVTFVSLVLVSIFGSALTNLFATDRAAFHSLLMAPAGMRAVVRAKVIAILMFCLGGELAGVLFLLARGVEWPLAGFSVVLAAGLFMWTTAVGMVSSALFPTPSDPQTVGGALVSTPAFLVISIGNSLYMAGALGLAYMLEWRGWSWPLGSAAGLALILASAFAMRAASSVSSRLIAMRQEAMLAALSSPAARA
jgi:hypothetical protein